MYSRLIYRDNEVLVDGENVFLKTHMLKCEMQVSVPAALEMIVPQALAGSQTRVYERVIFLPSHLCSVLHSSRGR